MKKIANGWVEGTVQEFLGLSDADAAYIEAKVALARAVRGRRVASGRTQADLARELGTSQSRLSLIERGDPSVSIDLAMRALLATGMGLRAAADVMAAGEGTRRAPRRAARGNLAKAGAV
jgi:transcriptional regulator with XRE-family HTH domain